MAAATLLLVDDDEAFRTIVGEQLARQGFALHRAASGTEALDVAARVRPDVVLLDLRLPDIDGLEVLRRLRERGDPTEVIMLTGQGSIETAVAAVRGGAADYVAKPCPLAELDVRIRKALESRRLRQRELMLENALSTPDPAPSFVGCSPEHGQLLAKIERAASSRSSVLICGETGTGKGMVARLLHARSNRSDRPFVVIDCASLQDDLLQNELFGHEPGAYTGASAAKAGLIEVAEGGTIFLDEIGEMSPATQAKLLRFLDDSTFRHLGATTEIHVDVRVIAATHRDLEAMVSERRFRADLLYRLRTITIQVPPLRQRADDIAFLARHFILRLNHRFGGDKQLASETVAALEAYGWPGNVRQLMHEMESAYVMADGLQILPEHLGFAQNRATVVEAAEPGEAGEQLATLEEVERAHLERVLHATHGHRTQTAKVLGISDRTLYRMLQRYGLS